MIELYFNKLPKDITLCAINKERNYLLFTDNTKYYLINSNTFVNNNVLNFYELDKVDVALYKEAGLDFLIAVN